MDDLALSTSYFAGRRLAPAAMAAAVRGFGLGRVELGYLTRETEVEAWEAAVAAEGLTVGSVHAFCPASVSDPFPGPESFSLAEPDGARRAAAVRAVLGSALAAVVDADGLFHLAEHLAWLSRGAQTVLTPHPGEMARLLRRKVEDPVQDAADFAREHGCTVLLKGALTVIAAPDGRLTFNCVGTSGMATAGSGDALTGLVLSLLAQGMSGYDAARAAAYLHAEAGLRAEEALGNASMNAWDLAQRIRL